MTAVWRASTRLCRAVWAVPLLIAMHNAEEWVTLRPWFALDVQPNE